VDSSPPLPFFAINSRGHFVVPPFSVSLGLVDLESLTPFPPARLFAHAKGIWKDRISLQLDGGPSFTLLLFRFFFRGLDYPPILSRLPF